MAFLWSLRGLSWRELAKRTCRRSWDDEVFGQAARLAFYYLLSMFPVLLLLLILFDKLAGPGSTGSNLRDTLLGAFQQILPRDASALIAKTVGRTECRSRYRRWSRIRGVGLRLGRLEWHLGHDDRTE